MLFVYKDKEYNVNMNEILEKNPRVIDIVGECGISTIIEDINLCFWYDYVEDNLEFSVLKEGAFVLVVLIDFSVEEEKMLKKYMQNVMK